MTFKNSKDNNNRNYEELEADVTETSKVNNSHPILKTMELIKGGMETDDAIDMLLNSEFKK